MPLHFENAKIRVAIVIVILTIPVLVIWQYIQNRQAFAAMAAANILLVNKVEQFESEVMQFKKDNDERFNEYTRINDEMTAKRKETLDSWVNYASRTHIIVGNIEDHLNDLAESMELNAQRASADRQRLLLLMEDARKQSVRARQQVDQKIVTAPEAEALKRQIKDLKKQKKKPVWNLFGQ